MLAALFHAPLLPGPILKMCQPHLHLSVSRLERGVHKPACYYCKKDYARIVIASHALPQSDEFSYVKVQDVLTKRTVVVPSTDVVPLVFDKHIEFLVDAIGRASGKCSP